MHRAFIVVLLGAQVLGLSAAPLVDSDLLPLRNKSFEQIQTDVFVWALRRNGNSSRHLRNAASMMITPNANMTTEMTPLNRL